ncbi:MAG: DoxX family protein [Acidobacteria bacterium]|nr:DoxX family protein [Acidobacteriota bacterium]
MFQRLIETSPTWITVPLRLALGIIFCAHGAQKVFGMWEGPGLAKFAANPAPLGMQPGWLWMGAAALAELVGGVLLLIGLLTRVGAALVAFVMLVAIIGVHWGAFFSNNRGMEYPLSLLGMALALLIAGGGQASADRALMGPRGRRR